MYNVLDVLGQVYNVNDVAGHIYKQMNSSQAIVEKAIIKTVSYVDAFDYPLTAAEIHRYLIQIPSTTDTISQTLAQNSLVPEFLERSGNYYMLPGRENVALIRKEREATATRLWPQAIRYGDLIAGMPFVRMVAVTGSLAVNNVGPDEDIDYLIVTANDRLWVCRAFIILLVRWAASRGVVICPNYFLAERALHLSNHNLYTAHELTQMVPLYGLEVYHALRRSNLWTYQYLPNAHGTPEVNMAYRSDADPSDHRPTRPFLETLLNTRQGLKIDQWEMNRKINKFRQTYSGWQESEFSIDCCKGHFNRHQHHTLRAFEQLVGNGKQQVLTQDENIVQEPI